MTRFLGERGIGSEFVNGLRVTTPDVLDAVLKVFAGSVNQELVAAFIRAGLSAVGLTGMDGLLTEARQLSPELGLVGEPVRSDDRLLNALIENRYLPVVACVGGDRSGRFYNVNADQMAASIAVAFKADTLIFLTDVDGVKNQAGHILEEVTPVAAKQLIDERIATGGMQAKLEAAAMALSGGVAEVVIAPGTTPDIVARILSGERTGTRLAPEIGIANNG